MKTYLRESTLACLLLGLIATGCDMGTKKAAENDIRFDSITVEKIYHLLDNPDNPNCDLEIKFVYPQAYADEAILEKLRKQFVVSYFGEDYEDLSPEEATRRYTDDYLSAYKDLEEDYKDDLANADKRPVGAWYSYYEMSSNTIAFNQADIISYTVSFENYTGGAHGAHAYNNHVLNLRTGRPITEEEIFVEDYQDSLARILVDRIARQNNLTDIKELEDIGFFSPCVLHCLRGTVDFVKGASASLRRLLVKVLVRVVGAVVLEHLVQILIGYLARCVLFRRRTVSPFQLVGKGNVLFVHRLAFDFRGSIWRRCGSLWRPFRHPEAALAHDVISRGLSLPVSHAVRSLAPFLMLPCQVEQYPQVARHHQDNQECHHWLIVICSTISWFFRLCRFSSSVPYRSRCSVTIWSI